MLNYARIQDKPRILRSFTGLTPQAFAHLLRAFGLTYEQAERQREAQRSTPRQRRRGGGRKPTPTTRADRH